MAVHVSIHDVSPAFAAEVELALAKCHAAGVRPALLVVPDYHGRAPLLADSPFAERLRELARDGHEIFLHGYFHRAGMHRDSATDDAQRPGAFSRFFAQRVVSSGEAEFSDISEKEARGRFTRGAEMLRAAGLPFTGFVPPAWSMPEWVRGMLAEEGIRFTEDHLRIYDPVKGTSRASVVLNFASRTPVRLFSTIAWTRLARPARTLFPVRIALHPKDMHVALLRSETDSLLRWARGDFVTEASQLFC